MSLTNPNNVVTEQRLSEFYQGIFPYLGGMSDGCFTPVGTIITVMGNSAPEHYLACDGQIVNIADYLVLANYFELQFGSKNYFGGDGTTTFAVPDLRGEFLRGTGTNSHANQGNGADVGVHQDATTHVYSIKTNTTRINFYGVDVSRPQNTDKLLSQSSDGMNVTATPYTPSAATSSVYTSRPTNTSVLYCIAVENIGAVDHYNIGSILVSSSNVDPGTYLGGTWQLIDKHLRDISGAVPFIANETNTGDYTMKGTLINNVYTILCYFTTLVQVTDSNIDYGTLDLSGICTGALLGEYLVGQSDGGNACWMAYILDDGTESGKLIIRSIDAVGTKPIIENTKLGVTFTVGIPFENRKDSACDMFYWKRTS